MQTGGADYHRCVANDISFRRLMKCCLPSIWDVANNGAKLEVHVRPYAFPLGSFLV